MGLYCEERVGFLNYWSVCLIFVEFFFDCKKICLCFVYEK